MSNLEDLPATQTAWRMVAQNRPKITRETVPVPPAGDDDVLLKIVAAGVCHSEFTLLNPNHHHSNMPSYTMGHEIVGIAVRLGKNAVKINPTVQLGKRYNVYSTNSCQAADCEACTAGHHNQCPRANRAGYGMSLDGGFASYVSCAARSLCLVPDGVTDGQASAATDACMTGYHAAMTAGATKDSTVLVMGVGGVGSMAIQTVKNVVRAKVVIGVDLHQPKVDAAVRLGADYGILAKDLPAFLKKNKFIPEVAIDCVGAESTLGLAAKALAPNGKLKVVGVHTLKYVLPTMQVMMKQLTIQGSAGGTFKDHCDCLEAVDKGWLTPSVEYRHMEDIEQALLDLDAGKIEGRVVLIPIGLPLPPK